MSFLVEVDWRELWGADGDSVESLGAVYTKPAVVDFILDLAGYSPEARRLRDFPLLEPSCGDGAFVDSVIERLVRSELHFAGTVEWGDPRLAKSIQAADISHKSILAVRKRVGSQLVGFGCPPDQAEELTSQWFVQADFLLESWNRKFSFVIGNPPYIRIECIPKRVLSRYRHLYSTTTDRADLYVAFMERGLELLDEGGTLGFICANRFVKNQYGAALRALIARHFRVNYYINLEHSQPFVEDVSAYPAIFIIGNTGRERPTLAATLSGEVEPLLKEARPELLGNAPLKLFQSFDSWYPDGSPWISTCKGKIAEIKTLEERFPNLEDSGPGTRVGIGVATGADSVFVLDKPIPEIESDRLLPLIMAADVSNDTLRFSGHHLINPFNDDGSLVDLSDYPGLGTYLTSQGNQLRNRHVAKVRPNSWYRTIDRIWPEWVGAEKLLIPDIQGTATIGFDRGEYYPHHNLYWIRSSSWPLLALKTILRSTFVYNQIKAYSVQMRGGALRYQAQTLRRVRLPLVASLTSSILDALALVSTSEDQRLIDEVSEGAFAAGP